MVSRSSYLYDENQYPDRLFYENQDKTYKILELGRLTKYLLVR